MARHNLTDIEPGRKRILVRVDFNVPLNSNGSIADDTRIKASLPTIEYLMKQDCRIILCSHLGNPHGKIVESLRLAAAGLRLEELLGKPVRISKDSVGHLVEETIDRMSSGEILLLENLRFYPGEETNDPAFAEALSRLADIYVNDAFAVSHRLHASVAGVPHYLPSATGFLMEKELRVLGDALRNPERPFAAIIGGAKVSDKLGMLDHILDKVNIMLIGGGMVATFLKSSGYNVGASFVENDRMDYVTRLAARARSLGVKLVIPQDVLVAERAEEQANVIMLPVSRIPDGWFIVDIGLNTAGMFMEEIKKSRTVIWNGPMGIFEMPRFSRGTRLIAQNLAELDTTTIIGGGSTAEAVAAMGLADRMSHVSTGGGATLEFLEGKELPGIAALQDTSDQKRNGFFT